MHARIIPISLRPLFRGTLKRALLGVQHGSAGRNSESGLITGRYISQIRCRKASGMSEAFHFEILQASTRRATVATAASRETITDEQVSSLNHWKQAWTSPSVPELSICVIHHSLPAILRRRHPGAAAERRLPQHSPQEPVHTASSENILQGQGKLYAHNGSSGPDHGG